ncbi:MAG: permease [Candidatus Bathyarchaeota archaeon]|nr:permease [Candidatus Bathyarchaeota archaeon]
MCRWKIDMEAALLNTLTFFANVLIEIIPLFLAVTFLAGLALEYIKPSLIREKLGGKKGVTGMLAATALGFVTPFCSCSTIPLLAGMLAAGIPISVLTAFLFASPYPVEVGLLVLGPMFGWPFAVAFVATGAILAILSGLLLQKLNWQDQIKDDFIKGLKPEAKSDDAEEEPAGCACGAEKQEPEEGQASCGCNAEQPDAEAPGCGCEAEPKPALSQPEKAPVDGFPQKAKRAAVYSLTFFKRMIPFILFGCSIGAIIYGFVPQDLLATYMGGSSILAVPIAALIGVPLYVSIIPIIPIVLSLSAKGVSNGAVIAFMITATAISPPELIMLSGMFKRKYLLLFVAMMIIGAIATGYVFNAIAL